MFRSSKAGLNVWLSGKSWISTKFSIRSYTTNPTPKAFRGPSQVKEVLSSWLISKNDSETQKRKAIESISRKGDKSQIRIDNRKRKYHHPSDNELEAREILLEKVNQIVENAGGVPAKPPQGSSLNRMVLYYQPDPSKKPQQ